MSDIGIYTKQNNTVLEILKPKADERIAALDERITTLEDENTTIDGVKTFSSDIVGNISSADKLFTARNINIRDNAETPNESTVTSFDGSSNVTLTLPSTIETESFVGNLTGNVTGNLTGNVTGNLTGNCSGSASTLATARSLTTNLASLTAASFDGSADASIGVSGVLPVANGGTGTTSLSNITAGKATCDGNGNTISSTYLPLSGGTMTGGAINFSSTGYCGIKKTTTAGTSVSGGLELMAGSAYNTAPSISLYNTGNFTLRSGANKYSLTGNTSGTLSWSGSTFTVGGTAVITSNNNMRVGNIYWDNLSCGVTYTAPTNGWFIIELNEANHPQNTNYNLMVNGVTHPMGYRSYTNHLDMTFYYPVRAGWTFRFDGPAQWLSFRTVS